MSKEEQSPNPLIEADLNTLTKKEILALDTALVREKLATYPVVAAAKDYTLAFIRNYSGFTKLRENTQFNDSFDIFIAKLEELIHTVCIEHAPTYGAVQEHTEGMTEEKLTDFYSWIETISLTKTQREELQQIITELIRLTSQYIAKYNATDATPPAAISEADFLIDFETSPELEQFFEEIEFFLENIQYPLTAEELIEVYCEHYSVGQEQLLHELLKLSNSESGIDFDSLYDLFGPILF